MDCVTGPRMEYSTKHSLERGKNPLSLSSSDRIYFPLNDRRREQISADFALFSRESSMSFLFFLSFYKA